MNFTILKYAVNYLGNKILKSNDKIQVLEPFTTILKLAIISFMDNGTKITITDNKLYIQPPSILQGTIRTVYGSNREEIHHLLKPIKRFIQLFPPENDEIVYIYRLAIEGLKLLKSSYGNESSTVCYTLDLYISIIENKLENKEVHIDSYDDDKQIEDLNLSTHSKINLEKIFIDIWDETDIRLVSSMLKSAQKLKDLNLSSDNNYINSIENIIKSKEILIDEKIKKAKNLL